MSGKNKNLDFMRQLDIVTRGDFNLPVTVIGVGGVGSPSVLGLAKMGVPNITVYEGDVVDFHNIPNQFYRLSDTGKDKAQAIYDICSDFAGTDIKIISEHYKGQSPLSDIVISAVDSMATRQMIWDNIQNGKSNVSLYIDSRMGAQIANIRTVQLDNPKEVSWYKASLHSDEESEILPCTARAVIFTVLVTAGLICNQVKRFSRGEDISKQIIFDLTSLEFIII